MILENYGWYLIKLNPYTDYRSRSGYYICQYIDGIFFEEQSEESLSDIDIEKIIKEL